MMSEDHNGDGLTDILIAIIGSWPLRDYVFEWMNEWMNEFYSHKPNIYSYKEINNNIQHINFCTCVEKLHLH